MTILAERVEYLDEDGKLVTESLRDYSKRTVRRQYASLDHFLRRWRSTERKQVVIDELAAEGLPLHVLAAEVNAALDPFDLICHVAFDRPPLTRRQRAAKVRTQDVFVRYDRPSTATRNRGIPAVARGSCRRDDVVSSRHFRCGAGIIQQGAAAPCTSVGCFSEVLCAVDQ